jgi:hypothetical protein
MYNSRLVEAELGEKKEKLDNKTQTVKQVNEKSSKQVEANKICLKPAFPVSYPILHKSQMWFAINIPFFSSSSFSTQSQHRRFFLMLYASGRQ